jgi:hypothetical protein
VNADDEPNRGWPSETPSRYARDAATGVLVFSLV